MNPKNQIAILILFLMALGPLAPAQTPAPEGASGPIPQIGTGETDGLTPQDNLSFNFRGAPLEDVLDYMSRAAGFVILSETEIQGTVDLWSHHPVSRDEAVELLNSVLNGKGYAAIRNGRVLMIVPRDQAKQYDIPVKTGNDPEQMEKSDEMITQIIQVRYANATLLTENIRELLPPHATLSSNESSNAVVLTAPQTTVRRITKIIRALDTSISEISMIEVFQLKHSDATEAAEIINKLFEKAATQEQSGRAADFMPPFMRGRRSDDEGDTENSEARSAAVRVLAVADERTNSVVVTAPDDVMPTIRQLIEQIDTSNQLITEVRVITLKYADAEEMADIVEEVFNSEETSGSQQTSQRMRGFFGRMMGPPMPQANQEQASQRKEQASKVIAVADTRTNSVVISAVEGLIDQINEMVIQLDSNSAKNQQVYVYDLQNANAETVAEILDGMFGADSTGSVNRSSNTNTTSRTGSTGSRTNSGSSRNTGSSTGSTMGSRSRN